MKPDRSAIMRDARRRWRSRQRWGEDLLTWAECLRRAWAAWRQRFGSVAAQMQEIATAIHTATKHRNYLAGMGVNTYA